MSTSSTQPNKRDTVSQQYSYKNDSNELTSALTSTRTSSVEVPEQSTAAVTEPIDAIGNPAEIKLNNEYPMSSFNPYFATRFVKNDGSNYPLTDEDVATELANNDSKLYRQITAKTLIDTPIGASIYAPNDFLYLKDYDAMKLNRLITLRRFAHPTFDDIFDTGVTTEPDIARMLTYSDSETNKFSDILTMTAGLQWKKLDSEYSAASMHGTDQSGISGILGNVMKFVDPKYGHEAMIGNPALTLDPKYDGNRVYGPVDSIAWTHIRDVGVNFTHEIELTFNYEIKSYNGLNQKSAFLDILSNIILMTTNDAKFWGGARYWVGARPSKYMSMLKKLDSSDWQEYTSKATNELQTMFGKFKEPGNAKAALRNIANNAMNLAFGALLNKLGRTGIPTMNSLLTGNPVGMWHLTVGNPLNPILVAGDLLLDNTTISFGDELGFDDFPTTIQVKCSLKHAKPKGRAEIENMFNCGKGRTYLKPSDESVFGRVKATNQQNAQTVGGNAAPSTFGTYDKQAVERNSKSVWSFMHDMKRSKTR